VDSSLNYDPTSFILVASLHRSPSNITFTQSIQHKMADLPLQSIYLNKGKFASVSYIAGSDLALKTVHSGSHLHCDELIKEFWM
jgi:hypothetical protein